MYKYFGTDGIRANHDYFVNNNFSSYFGKAIGLLDYDNIYIGYDTRCSSQTICYYIIAGILSTGKNVHLLDIASTPCVQFYSLINKTLGICVTASHNKYSDNGIKVFINGVKIDNELILNIENSLDNLINNNFDLLVTNYGKLHRKSIFEYLQFLKEKTSFTKYYLLDTANGACSYIGQYVFDNLINNKPNGININYSCGPTNLLNLKKHLNKFEYIFSVDGDGDRINIIDGELNIYTGDILLYIINKYKVKSDKVVLSKMTNKGVIDLFEKDNVKVFLSDVGDTALYNKMIETSSVLGAEPSGHIINLSNVCFGDGLLNALDIVNIINTNNLNLKDIYKTINLYHELNRNFIGLSLDEVNKITNILNNTLDIYYVFRKSGTENLYRLYLCSDNINNINNVIKLIEKEVINE